uniref:Nucleolar protein 8 n=1 Tax=Dicentrarchus labrax TaxID=13489 RepID=E6ZGF4_DICLA|nr:Nucleolar protein 8 [Dicentrarchus labrax]
MRRLYIGGLSHTVTQKDLKDRFGKFGDVEDVELRTRRDEEGIPYKTFGYININISDADLKKCLTVLNKSKWKGGTLQIETAKESFLHRLAEERQEAEEQRLQQPAAEDTKQKMLDSLSGAGVENFTMKAAVPGTEIPGHKDWVVSKFGRVLPVMQLRCKKGSKARTLKYDPSKYSHNIRKLDRTAAADEPTPVTQLTWEVLGGDDDISKKRRGEFPPFEPSRPKKSRTDTVNSQNDLGRTRLKQTVVSVDHTEAHQFTNGNERPTNHRPAQRRRADSDIDSDEEICRIVASQNTSHAALGQEEDEDNLEVVGLDYLVKSARSRQHQKDDEEENDYDSADTDELLASKKPPPPPRERLTPPTAEHQSGNDTDRKRKRKTKNSESDSDEDDDGDEDEEELESADSSSDSDYDAMFSNVTRLEISLADLQKLAEESQQASTTEEETKLTSAPAERPTPKKGTTPEEILAALMEDDSSEDEQQKKKKKKKRKVVTSTLPAFQGTRAVNEGLETEESQRSRKEEEEEEEEEEGSEVKKQKLDSEAPQLNHKATDSKSSRTLSAQKHTEREETSESSEDEEDEEDDEEEEEEEDEEEGEEEAKASAMALPSSSSSSTAKDAVKAAPRPAPHSESSSSEEEEEEEKQAPPRVPLGAKEEEERQRQANLRRLAAVQQRQKEAEEHKKLIQGALAKLVRLKPSVPQLFNGSEEEEEEEDNEEEDGSRFDIRPQFEGREGQKLMALQSRFGTDERFRLDSRFLEDDEDKEEESERKMSVTEDGETLEEERKKNLSILQSVLGSSQQTCSSKPASKAKTFRDVSALHYDPSREEHAAFETKTNEIKESKAARRKKREEAQKLPEVSKEIYYDVSGDLKAVFGQTKDDDTGGQEKANWDQEGEEEKAEEGGKDEEPTPLSSLLSADPGAEKEESSGFKFSFFEDDTETGSKETEYKVESIQAPKVSWQQDPRFHDSSSEDEEEEEEEQEEDEEQSTIVATTEEETPSKPALFFFYPEDSRLTEGPRLFCRSSQLEEQREEWEERRSALRQEYRKKHKDARRKLKSSQKS